MHPSSRADSAALTLVRAATSTVARSLTVGGATGYPAKTIVENALMSHDHTTLVAAVAAEPVETLSGPAPFTVFAPTDAAFAR